MWWLHLSLPTGRHPHELKQGNREPHTMQQLLDLYKNMSYRCDNLGGIIP